MEKIVLDFSKCRYLGEIHNVLKEGFDFPDYYGENWDALRDCLADYCEGPLQVQIKGLLSLPKEFDDCMRIMLRIFKDVHKDTPNVEFGSIVTDIPKLPAERRGAWMKQRKRNEKNSIRFQQMQIYK